VSSAIALPVLPTTPSDSGAAAATERVSALAGTYARAPITLVGGWGADVFDDAGRSYLDFASGIAVNALGYGDRGLQAAMHAAVDGGLIHASNLYHTRPGEALAQWLTDHSFAARVFLCNSGAEANEGAFKFARRWARSIAGGADAGAASAKHEIIALRGAFHGRLFASLAATDRPAYRAPFRPLAGGISVIERDMKDLDSAVSAETVAAVIVEPVQGEGGVRVLDPGFLRELRALTQDRRVALIFDEIQCGLGRTGYLFAYERAQVEPDILTLAKPLAGGLPMGAVLMSADIANTIQTGDHGSTFGGGPFVASVARYVVERLADPALLAAVRENGQWLGAELGALADASHAVRTVRGVGLMWGIDVRDRAAEVVRAARERGLLILTAGEHTVRLVPPLTITRGDLERGVGMLREILA